MGNESGIRYTKVFGGNSGLKNAYCIDAKEVKVIDGKVIGYPIKRFGDYEEWDIQGRLFLSPVALRQEVYRINPGAEDPIIPMVVSEVRYAIPYNGCGTTFTFRARDKKAFNEHIYFENSIGITVFLSPEDAAEALEGTKHGV